MRTNDTEQQLFHFSMLVDDVPGVLSQVSRLFSQKGYNIQSIVSGRTQEPGVTRITITMLGTQREADQVTAQCYKIFPVRTVKILDEGTSVERELVLVKVCASDQGTRNEIIQLSSIFRADIVDVSRETLTVAILGNDGKVSAFLDLMMGFQVMEVVRTGTLAIERGKHTIYDRNKLQSEYEMAKI